MKLIPYHKRLSCFSNEADSMKVIWILYRLIWFILKDHRTSYYIFQPSSSHTTKKDHLEFCSYVPEKADQGSTGFRLHLPEKASHITNGHRNSDYTFSSRSWFHINRPTVKPKTSMENIDYYPVTKMKKRGTQLIILGRPPVKTACCWLPCTCHVLIHKIRSIQSTFDVRLFGGRERGSPVTVTILKLKK